MQVLPYVISMLMLIGAITYTRLESYREHALVRIAYENYMRDVERLPLEEEVYKIYDNITVTESTAQTPNEEAKLNTKLSIKGFINAADRQTDTFPAIVDLFLRILHEAYSPHTFYKNWLDTQSSQNLKESEALQQFLNDLFKGSDLLEAQGIPPNNRLEKIEFPNLETRNFFCKLLNGQPGNAGYPPLSHYTSTNNIDSKISVYLADKNLLNAIFQDPYLVESIILKRKDLYRDLINDRITKADGSADLQALTGNRTFTQNDQLLLNYMISKSRPPKQPNQN